jgi:hypothetical protein
VGHPRQLTAADHADHGQAGARVEGGGHDAERLSGPPGVPGAGHPRR